MIRPLISDENYYIQKGVGWTLREANQVYPSGISELMEKFLFDLSPIAFTTVCEKISKEKTEEYKLLRKNYRKK